MNMKNRTKVSKQEMLDELRLFYDDDILQSLNTHKKIYSFFEKHIKENSEEIYVSDLFENSFYHDKVVFIDTPDGFSEIGDYIKKIRDCVLIQLENYKTIECSIDHLIETDTGWKRADNLSYFDKILTNDGFSFYYEHVVLDKQSVYDFEVLTKYHRYWTANGISSHNTAKTFVACYAALDLIKDGGEIDKIVLARPAVESGENLGFLPGTIDEKIAPYMEGYTSNMEKIINPEKLKQLITKKLIIMEPLAFMRSKTYDNTILILDEAQNADLRQIILVTTRMGNNSKIVICGDVTQWDIKNRRKDLLTFTDKIIDDIDSMAHFEFTREDIVRNPILIKLTDKYEQYKIETGIDSYDQFIK